MSNEVFITGITKYLPNNPVSNDEMEDYLGMINNKPSKARRIVLRNNGIINRYYALEKGGKPTHTNAELAAESVKMLFPDRIKERGCSAPCLRNCITRPDDAFPCLHGTWFARYSIH